jgi:predicted MFS family arabinose efflux permease
LALDAASFLLAAVAVIGIGSLVASAPQTSTGLDAATHEPGSMRALLRRRSLRSLLLADGLSAVVFALILPVEVVFVTQTLGAGTGAFGLVLTAWGLGAVVGAGTLVRFARVGGRMLVAASLALMIAGYLGMGTADSVAVVVGFSFLGGIGNGLEGGGLLTLIQQQAADREQSALNTLLESIHSGGPGVGYVLGGVIAATASPRATYVVAAAGGLVALSALIRLRPLASRPRATPATA